MNYDVSKLPEIPQVVIERPFFKVAESDCASNDFAKQQQSPLEASDLGGYPFRTAGTAGTPASGVSLSTVQSYQIEFMPREGVIPSVEMQKQHMGDVMAWIIEIKPLT